jgi:hypothetical protein
MYTIQEIDEAMEQCKKEIERVQFEIQELEYQKWAIKGFTRGDIVKAHGDIYRLTRLSGDVWYGGKMLKSGAFNTRETYVGLFPEHAHAAHDSERGQK